MSITPEERAAWAKLAEDATPITKISEDRIEGCFDAWCGEGADEASCADFDFRCDALLFESAAPIIRQLLEENAALTTENEALREKNPEMNGLLTNARNVADYWHKMAHDKTQPPDASKYSGADELTDIGISYRQVDEMLHPGDWR